MVNADSNRSLVPTGRLQTWIEHNVYLSLKSVPFSKDDETVRCCRVCHALRVRGQVGMMICITRSSTAILTPVCFGHIMGPIQRVNVDFASPMLDELDNAAKELNISRQAVIKTLSRQALDQHYLATARQPAAKQR
jgi:hypothetical protein